MALRYKSRSNYRRIPRSRAKYRARKRSAPRRRTYRKRQMSVRRIRNITSRKCQDNMMPITISDDGVTEGTPGVGVTMVGDFVYTFCFVPSGRMPGPQYGASERRRARTFARGYKETGLLETQTDAQWIWRRIVFRMRLGKWIGGFDTLLDPTQTLILDHTTNGMMRTLWNLGNTTDLNAIDRNDALDKILFKGTQGQDWADKFTAPVDPTSVYLIRDKTRYIGGSMAASGRFHRVRDWYPVNRTLVYEDTEHGQPPDTATPWSDESRTTCGDVVVLDMFRCASGDVTDTMSFSPEGCYYWHE
ncbi:capsid [Badger associated gemykibivirus 1]|uniref:Capsid n=1 Tax=Badger associated gemykibivirus 1 TaxID=1634484 RepID=A0A0E3JHI0_9VIRU|nr:capsid [Badger associated gemykibivirus 1]AKA58508.1 capsid [Badger associated gemykibivirus 1]